MDWGQAKNHDRFAQRANARQLNRGRGLDCPPHHSAGIVAKVTASTVAQYLAARPADRRAALSAVRKLINENLPDGYEEGMQFGFIGW